jgi:hypothetical protein
VIFISNKPLRKIPQAMLSRALFVDVSMTPTEKIERLRAIVPNIEPETDLELKLEILDLMDTMKDRIDDLNVRTFLKVLECRAANTTGDWKRLAMYLMLTSTK